MTHTKYKRVKWSAFDWERIKPTTNTYRRDHKYSPVVAAFDLESTNYKNLFAFMYIWTFTSGDQTEWGRTW